MGGHPYQYVVPYDDDLQAALDRLRREVFARGAFYGAEQNPKTPEQAVKMTGETGTRSILDIERVKKKPDSCCVAPLTAAELQRYFGTDRPTLQTVETCDQFWEELERGMARCVTVYDGDRKQLFFVGYSFD